MSEEKRTPRLRTAEDLGFLIDGYERAYAGAAPYVRRQVEEEFAERLSKATPESQKRIRDEMEQLIATRIDQLAPPDALY